MAISNACRVTLAGVAFLAVNQLAISETGQALNGSGDLVGALARAAAFRSAGLALLACFRAVCIQTKDGRLAEPWLG
jgi:hypothetical protein